ncbi:MAG: hypothetical protein ACOCWQ_00840 [Nanoarchaeota archaeon]
MESSIGVWILRVIYLVVVGVLIISAISSHYDRHFGIENVVYMSMFHDVMHAVAPEGRIHEKMFSEDFLESKYNKEMAWGAKLVLLQEDYSPESAYEPVFFRGEYHDTRKGNAGYAVYEGMVPVEYQDESGHVQQGHLSYSFVVMES